MSRELRIREVAEAARNELARILVERGPKIALVRAARMVGEERERREECESRLRAVLHDSLPVTREDLEGEVARLERLIGEKRVSELYEGSALRHRPQTELTIDELSGWYGRLLASRIRRGAA